MNRITEPIYITPTECISRREWCIRMAEEFTKKYSEEGFIYLPGNIQKMVDVCRSGDDLPEDSPKEDYEIIEAICQLLEQSKQWEAAHTGPETPAGGPLTEEPAQECSVVVCEPTLSTEELIVQGAKEARLDNGAYQKLSEIFEFGDDMTSIRTREGAIETPEHAGMLLGLGANMGKCGLWLCIQGAQRLLVQGHSNAMEQVCADLKLSPQSIYNYVGCIPYATPEARRALPPTVLVELCRGRYAEDDAENERVKKELVQEAIQGKWDSSEARSHARMRKGKDEPLEGKPSLREQLSAQDREIARLKEALRQIYDIQNVDSGLDWQEIDEARDIARMALGISDPQPQQEAA